MQIMNMKYKKIAVICASKNQNAIEKKDFLIKKYGFLDFNHSATKADNLDLVIALGGDGTMLHLLHKLEKNPIPLYGINCGTVGFLMNAFREEDLNEILNAARESIIHPLRMEAVSQDNKKYSHIAINEISLLRQMSQATKINIKIDNFERLSCLTADGILVATPAGSTAYNLSLRGPIIPLDAKMLALTPISPFRPRNWHGAILSATSEIEFAIIDSALRPVSATADYIEVRDIKKVVIKEDSSLSFKLLFDPSHSLEERIVREQFFS